MLWCIIFMHKFSKTGWEICDFTLRSRLGFSYVIPGIIMSSWNTSNCYVTFPRDLLDFTVFSDMMFCQLFLPEWLCGVSMEYSGGFLKMLGIFPESFLLLEVSICVCGEGEPGGVANGLVPRNRPGLGRRKVRSEWLLPSSGRTALHLEHQWTPRMFSLTWRNIAPFKITAAPIFVKVKKTGKSAYYEDDDVFWEHLCCKLCASDVQSPQWYYHQNMPSW